MRRGLRLALSCIAVLTVGACATYKPPTAGATARIKFLGDHYYAYIDEGDSCSTRQMVGKELWPSTYVNTGKRIRIEQGIDTSGLAFGFKCGAAFSFVPQPETTYVSEYKRAGSRCRIGLNRLTAKGELTEEPSMRMESPRACF